MNKSKFFAVLLSAAFLLAGCSSTQAPKQEDSSASTEKIIMATEAGFAPYEYYDGDQVVGVDVDIAKEIAKAMGGELQVVDMDFGAITTAVSTGKATFGGAGMSITPERLEEVDFSIEYAVSKQVIVIPSDSTIADEDSLNEKNVGVQLGTVADLYLTDEKPEVKVVQYNKYADAASDLLNGRLDAIVMDELPATEMVAEHAELTIASQELFTDKYAFAVKKGDKETLDQINQVLEKLIKEGKIEEYTLAHTAK